MLNGVHKPDAANKETRLLERRHAGPRPTLAASSARPRHRRAQSRLLPPPSDASSTRLAHAAPPRRTTARRGLSPRLQRTRCVCLRHMDRNYPLLATDCVGRRARVLFFAYSSNEKIGMSTRNAPCIYSPPRLYTLPLPGLLAAYLSRSNLYTCAKSHPHPLEFADPSAYQTPRATAHCVHGQHDVSATRRRKPTGRTTIWKSQSRLAHAPRALARHSSRRAGKPPARAMRAPAAPFALVSQLRTRTRAHHTRAGVQDVDGVTIPRSAWLT
ncbi:hypothetical protein C8R45DRAFT_943248 [Mycena sanguinolenta]|nr:hypothetical protein C8R45DRAFT_943248 [Mycena sanguinolenta]